MSFGRYNNPRYPLDVGGKICRTKEEEDAQRARMVASDPISITTPMVPEEDYKSLSDSYEELLRAYETRGSRIAELDQIVGDLQNQREALLKQIAELEANAAQPKQNG